MSLRGSIRSRPGVSMVWEACSDRELSVRLPIPAASWSGGCPPSSAGFPSPYLVFRGLRSSVVVVVVFFIFIDFDFLFVFVTR